MQENALELNNPLNAVSDIEYIEGVIEDVLCSNVDDVEWINFDGNDESVEDLIEAGKCGLCLSRLESSL